MTEETTTITHINSVSENGFCTHPSASCYIDLMYEA